MKLFNIIHWNAGKRSKKVSGISEYKYARNELARNSDCLMLKLS